MTSREDIYRLIKILIIFDESSSLDFVETKLSVDFLTFHKVFSNFSNFRTAVNYAKKLISALSFNSSRNS